MQKVILVLLILLVYSKANLHGQNNFAFNLKLLISHSVSKIGGKYNSYEYRLVGGINYTHSWKQIYYSPAISFTISKGSEGNYALYSKLKKCKSNKAFELLLTPFNFIWGSHSIIEFNQVPLNQLSSNYASFNNINNKYLINFQSHIIMHKRKNKFFCQQIGQIQGRLNNLQLGYYNDGPPFNWMGLGDGFDRYITGGGYVKMSLINTKTENYIIGWEFSKFTGYMVGAFETLNLLGFEYLMMSDESEQTSLSSSNKILFSINNNRFQGELFFNFRDPRIDIQDSIHKYLSKNPIFLNKKYPSTLFGMSIVNYKNK